MSGWVQDMRYALRQLRKAPGFTVTAVLTLALGIGANAAIFTLVHAVLLQNLPVSDPATLIRVGDKNDCCVNGGNPDHDDYSLFAYDLYRHLQATTPELEQLAAVQAGNGAGAVTVRRGVPDALARSSNSEYVSGNYFQTLGLKPFAGRLMQPSDDVEGATPVVVMSYRTWQHDYAMDPSVVGSTFFVNTVPVTVIGIAPPSFFGDRMTDARIDFFIPMTMEPALDPGAFLHKHDMNWVYLLGRVKPGTELVPLEEKMSASLRNWLAALPLYQTADGKKTLARVHLKLTPGGAGITQMRDAYAKGLYLLMGIAGLVLLIACANIANMVLARGMARRGETSIRMALGAARRRIIRQMLTESVVLASLGGLAGLAVAYGGTRMLIALASPHATNTTLHADLPLAVLGFAFALSLVTGAVFGIAPAWVTSHAEPADALRGSNRTTQDKSSLLRRSLVIVQAALSLVLLIGAGLLTKSLNHLQHQDFGLETANRYVIHINPQSAGYKPEQLQALYEGIEQRLGSLPGVARVALTSYTPMEGDNWNMGVYVQGRPEPRPGDRIASMFTRVSLEYFDAIGHRLLRGREFTAQDTSTSPQVAVVNQAFVHYFFPKGEDPIGMHFGLKGTKSADEIQIVGVVSDVKYNRPRDPVRPMFFRPLLQMALISEGGAVQLLYAGAIVLETKGPIEGLESQVRRTLSSINPNLTVVDFQTFDAQIAGQFNQERLIARLTLLFGLLALVLASVGLYGVTSYTVARRTSEIGIRMALGADRGSVVRMVLREAMLQACIGLAIGVPVALVCVRFMKAQMYGESGLDISVLAGAALVLAVSACVAGLIPARRAASTDPVKALRTE